MTAVATYNAQPEGVQKAVLPSLGWVNGNGCPLACFLPGTDDEQKRRLISQLMALDASYHGGVAAYIHNARQLLKDSKEGG